MIIPKPLVSLAKIILTIFAIFALLFALKFRFSNLNLPFWGDEYQTINVARGIGRLAGKPSLAHAWKLHA